jgi:hypothetical protein
VHYPTDVFLSSSQRVTPEIAMFFVNGISDYRKLDLFVMVRTDPHAKAISRLLPVGSQSMKLRLPGVVRL